MSVPLGLTAGNALEVRESVEVLAGGGPADVVELTLALAREMLAAAGVTDVDPAEALRDGTAMDVWRAMIAAQGGDPDAELPVAPEQHVVPALPPACCSKLDALAVGVAAWRLGAGPGPQGGPGVRRRGRRAARQAGRRGPRGAAAAHPARRRPEPASSEPWRR